jgi:hypothetical protein
MTAPKALDIVKQAAARAVEPPSIKATYAGTYYKKTADGYEHVPFEKTYRWPLQAVANKDFTPLGLFHRYKKTKLMEKLGGTNVRIVQLVKVEGDLPPIRDPLHRLNWIADYAQLVKYAEEIGTVPYIHVDLRTGEREQRETAVDPHLYPDANSLRQAIKLILTEPEAFDREQQKLERKDSMVPKSMEAEIAALSDDD